MFRYFIEYLGFGFKSLAILSVVFQLTACSLDEAGTGASAETGTGTGIGTATISWVAPSARADGTALDMTEIAGYRIYWGTKEGNYPDRVDIDDGYEMQGTVTAKRGRYYVVVTTYDTDGRESAYSFPPLKIDI